MNESYIKTVTGLIEPLRLGFCQCHEHLYIKDEINDYDLSLKELIKYKKAGGCSLVDAQPQNAGASIEVLRKLSNESGVNIIASTGFHKLFYYTNDCDIYTKSQSDLADTYMKDMQKVQELLKLLYAAILKEYIESYMRVLQLQLKKQGVRLYAILTKILH